MSTRSDDPFAKALAELRADLETYLRRSIPSQDAGDLAAHIILKAWEARETYDPKLGTLRDWLYGIARNLLTHFTLRAYRRREQLYPPEQLDPIGTEEPDPERQMMHRQGERMLHEFLAQLPEKPRTAVVLFKLEEMPIEEAAKEMETNPNTAYSRVRLAMGGLKGSAEKYRADDLAQGGDGRPPFLMLPFLISRAAADRPAAPSAEAPSWFGRLGCLNLVKAAGLALALAILVPTDAVLDRPRPEVATLASFTPPSPPPMPEPEPVPAPPPEPTPPAAPPRPAAVPAPAGRPPMMEEAQEAFLLRSAEEALSAGRASDARKILYEHAMTYTQSKLAARRGSLLDKIEGR